MKTFRQHLNEDDDSIGTTKKSVTNFVATNLNRFANSQDAADLRAMLLLIAALNVLNTTEDNPNAVQTARRLANVAMMRSTGKKRG